MNPLKKIAMNSILLILLTHVITAVGTIAIANNAVRKIFSCIACTISLASSINILIILQTEKIISYSVGGWDTLGIVLVADYLTATMIILGSIVSLIVSVFSWYGAPRVYHERYFYSFFHFMTFAVLGSFLAGDLFNLYVMFEVMLISSFALMIIGGEKTHYRGAIHYMIINLVASAIFISSAALFYSYLGTLNMAEIAHRISLLEDKTIILAPSVMLMTAFALKSGLVPFHFWLPASYVHLLSVNGGLHAGLLTKVGVYALIRSFSLFFYDLGPFLFDYLMVISVASMFVGVIGALSSFSIRRILSFHIISQIGYKTLALSIFSTSAIAAAIFYTCFNMLTKMNLFLICGVIEKKYGTDDLSKIGGALKWSTMLAITFIISGLALGGIPPLPGFFAKFLVIKAALSEDLLFPAFAAIAVGMFSLFSMIKIWAEAFLKEKPEETQLITIKPREKFALIGSTMVMASLVLAMGLGSGTLYKHCKKVAVQLKTPTEYISHIRGGS